MQKHIILITWRTTSPPRHRCKKTFFLRFLTFIILPTFFLFLKTFIENTIWNHFRNNGNKLGSVWLFFFVPMLEFPYRPIYWQALLFTYRIGLHQVTPLGVMFFAYVGKLVGWKTSTFFIQRLQTFFVTFLRFLTFFIFFLERFYIYAPRKAIWSRGFWPGESVSWGHLTGGIWPGGGHWPYTEINNFNKSE